MLGERVSDLPDRTPFVQGACVMHRGDWAQSNRVSPSADFCDAARDREPDLPAISSV